MKMNTKSLLLTAGALVGTSLLAAAWVTMEGHSHVWLSDTLIGTKVVGARGEAIGKVEDIVVNPAQDSSYAVLSLGSWANMADRYYAMPWSMIRTVEADVAVKDSVRSLVLTVDKELLRTAPNFEKRTWPDMTAADWSREIDAFYNPRKVAAKEGEVIEAASRVKAVTWRATELKGADVVTPTNEKLGDIEQVAVDTNGRFCYAAVSVGGFLGMGEKLVAVPWDAFQFTLGGEKNNTRIITLASTKKMLESAPEYSNDDEDRARMCNSVWILSVYEHFSCPPYWDVEAKAPAKPERPAGK